MSPVLVVRLLEESDASVLEKGFAEMGWHKPESQFRAYLEEQSHGRRTVWVAEWEGAVGGYITVLWTSPDPVFRAGGIPEINDLNVLSRYRRRGIATTLMDAAEARVAERAPVVGLGVGLHPGYGPAQRLYVLRGYVPDGAGVVLDGRSVPEGASIELDDRPVLRMTKRLV